MTNPTTIQRNETQAKKDFGNPVQVNASDTLINRSTETPTNLKEEREMREKTAHIGWKASQASQGNDVDNKDQPMSNTTPDSDSSS
jgi:geranylgeranyl pyrophosphate synthase